ncbi:MAG: DUF2059 domain-containing protein [Sphingomicrobium sp.]
MVRLICAVLLIASGAAMSASAAPASAAAQIRLDPAAMAAAERLLTAMDYDRMMRRTVDSMLDGMAPVFKQSLEARTGQKVDDELIRRLIAIQGEFMRGALVNSPSMRRAVATIYASKFTAAELNHLARLYDDPVMRKWSEVGPAASAQLIPLVQGVLEGQRGELERRIKAAVLNYYAEQGRSPSS